MNLSEILSGNMSSAEERRALKHLFERVEYLEHVAGTSLDSPQGENYKKKKKMEKIKNKLGVK